MIREDKQQAALAAINAALVMTRHLSQDSSAGHQVAEVLDAIEYLPRLLADPQDRTDAFRQVLTDLIRLDGSFGLALHRFDTVTAYTW